MPRWGRPPGVRNGKQARRRATQWEDFDGVRFEEIDGDDDGDDAVLGSLQRHGTKGNNNTSSTREVRLRNDDGYDYDSELSDGEDFDLNDDADSTVAFAVQLAMRDKEDMLVEKALERIRRAQMLGKKNVRLSQEELDALDRRRKQAASSKKVPLSKATGFTRPLDSKRRKSGELAKTSSQAERRRSSQEQYLLDESSIAYAKASSGAFHAAPNNRPSSSSSRPRTPTMQSLRPQSSANSPLTMHQPAYGQRYPDRDPLQPASPRDAPYIRALPDDPQWAPRQRSSSNAAPYPVDNFMYGQPYGLGPGDPRLNYNGRRYAPTSMPYNGSGYPPVSEEPRRGSSGRQTRAESSEEESSSEDEDEDEEEDSEEEEDDDDGEHGVQVAVVEQPPIRKPAARTTAAQNKNNNNNNNNNTRPRRRNGR